MLNLNLSVKIVNSRSSPATTASRTLPHLQLNKNQSSDPQTAISTPFHQTPEQSQSNLLICNPPPPPNKGSNLSNKHMKSAPNTKDTCWITCVTEKANFITNKVVTTMETGRKTKWTATVSSTIPQVQSHTKDNGNKTNSMEKAQSTTTNKDPCITLSITLTSTNLTINGSDTKVT